MGTDPLRAHQQKKQCSEAKITRILVCPAFFGMHWDLLKLKCAQNLGLRQIPVLGAKKKQHRFLDRRMPTNMDATKNGRSLPNRTDWNTDVERAAFEWRGRGSGMRSRAAAKPQTPNPKL